VSYALQSARDQVTQTPLPNSPRHVAKARISLPGPTRRSILSVDSQYLSSRATLAGSTVSAAFPVGVSMIQPFGHSWELFGSVRNLFDEAYSDPVSSALVQDSVPQNGRTARIGLRWSPGAK
jgi:outer membrane receptor protein involved in Fe transport